MKLINILSAIPALFISLNVSAQDQIPSPATEVDSIIANGSGCPDANPVAVAEGSDLLILLPDMHSKLTENATITRNFCQSSINIYKPEGWSYRIKNVSYHIATNIKDGAVAKITTSVYEQGAALTSSQSLELSRFKGELNVESNFNKALSCDVDRALNLKTVTTLKNLSRGNGSAVVKQSGDIRIQLEWFPCY